MKQLPPTDAERIRFQSKCKKRGDCIIWTGLKDKDGYGIIGIRHRNHRAHRVAMWLADRAIPTGFVVNHTCRRRDCVNPQHLSAISASDNSKKDSTSAGYINSQKTHCKNGHEFDRKYSGRRYCSVCESEKTKRLRAKWKAEGRVLVI